MLQFWGMGPDIFNIPPQPAIFQRAAMTRQNLGEKPVHKVTGVVVYVQEPAVHLQLGLDST